jgi:hypothetical protein
MENTTDKQEIDRFTKQWAECVNEFAQNVGATNQESYKKDIKLFVVNSKFNRLNKRRQKKFLKTAPHVVLSGAYPTNMSDIAEDGKVELTFNYDQSNNVNPEFTYNYFAIKDQKENENGITFATP